MDAFLNAIFTKVFFITIILHCITKLLFFLLFNEAFIRYHMQDADTSKLALKYILITSFASNEKMQAFRATLQVRQMNIFYMRKQLKISYYIGLLY